MKGNKGITLVALVITVVVMLILAGVAISAIVDGNGLFSKSRQAVGEYENASKKEADQMQELINEIDKYLTGENGGEDFNKDKEPAIGDFVNYSVEVDGVTYDKWRILDFDNNGHMEIVCYNGPSFKLGEGGNVAKCKSDYAKAIKILNDESIPYGNGTYGYSTRHLGSDPSNPSSYETISTSYVKYYSNYNSSTFKPTANLAYLEQTHHESDVNAIKSFSDTEEGKNLAGSYIWLASRDVDTNSGGSYFHVHYVNSSGVLYNGRLYDAFFDGNELTNSFSYALAPVVSLESGVKINTSLVGNGSEDSPWVLTK